MHLSVPTIIGAASLVQAFPHFAYPNTRFALPPSKGLKGLKTGNESWGTLKPNHFTWSPPGPNDQRAPCPVMNTLSNHGFVPHNGRNITKDILIKALNDALNVPEAQALDVFVLRVQPS
ncbi:hypothetical protein CSIM01_08928 [Colletotrichum simmondsii]|uniref:Heme haloperoxidase family profile domain-containing protein n=1 Tax=Colletotrichum simmondsii TaxID=703756 RepID=A0A135SHF9_9PEZI|nr:hypothetical protein CSIM01_08928 [Colletotrichum simmondsii]